MLVCVHRPVWSQLFRPWCSAEQPMSVWGAAAVQCCCILVSCTLAPAWCPRCHQGSHSSWKFLDFFGKISRTWKVLDNDFGLGKSWNLLEYGCNDVDADAKIFMSTQCSFCDSFLQW